MKRRIWTTIEGKKIPVRKMEDSHLLNAHRMLRERGFVSPRTVAFYVFGPKPESEGALDCFDAEFELVTSAPINPALDWFDDEIKRRKISPLPIREETIERYRVAAEEAEEQRDRELAEIVGPNT